MRCLSLLFLFFGAAAAAADCALSLEEVLAAYAEARGGTEALERQHAIRIVADHSEGQYQPRFDFRAMKPGYMRVEARYRDGYVYIEGFDGTRGWEQPDGRPAEYVTGDAGSGLMQAAMSPVHLYGLNHMESLGAEVKSEGCTEIDGNDYYVINVMARFGTDIDYYVNAKTYRMERARTVRPLHPTQDPTPITLEERWTDFRFVNGVLHPFGYTQTNVDTGEQLSRQKIVELSSWPDAEPEDFAKP